MTSSDWVSFASVLGTFAVLVAVAIDRNRLQRRVNNAEGQVTGLSLDLDAVNEQLAALTAYLGRPDSWDVAAVAPPELCEPPGDRWTSPVRPASRTDGVGAVAAVADPTTTKPRPLSR